jgi:hypothetical protein
MQRISVETFSYNKVAQVLSEDASSLTGQLDLKALLNYETFQVVGRREIKLYQFVQVKRDGARHEIGDIVCWEFRPVDGFNRGVPGPKLVIFND